MNQHRQSPYPITFDVSSSDTATVVLTRTDGLTVTVENAIYDTVGPVGAGPGVVAVETASGENIHVPFVMHWKVV